MLRALIVIVVALSGSPLVAQSAGKVAEGAVMTPVEDVNLKKREIPPVLIAATEDPYARSDTRTCRQVIDALSDLDIVLGPDFDADSETGRRVDAGRLAKGVVASFIPFRGVVREVSGAAGAERRYNAAVDAGIARRGFLRGIAASRGCRLPSPPAVVTPAGDPPTQPGR